MSRGGSQASEGVGYGGALRWPRASSALASTKSCKLKRHRGFESRPDRPRSYRCWTLSPTWRQCATPPQSAQHSSQSLADWKTSVPTTVSKQQVTLQPSASGVSSRPAGKGMPLSASVRTQIGMLVIATSVVQFANGFFGTYISLRVAIESFDVPGLVLSAYFATSQNYQNFGVNTDGRLDIYRSGPCIPSGPSFKSARSTNSQPAMARIRTPVQTSPVMSSCCGSSPSGRAAPQRPVATSTDIAARQAKPSPRRYGFVGPSG
jgi:hypothetical protein